MSPGVRRCVASDVSLTSVAGSSANCAAMKLFSAISMKLSYVPDSSPGAVMDSGASGRSVVEPSDWASASASFQLAKSSDSGPKSAYRSAKVRHSIGLSIAVMTAMPSKPTFSYT
jgi:hypothetical protein